MYRNLAILFFNWSNYGYRKSQKALDFNTFNFYDNVLGNEKKLVGSDVLHIEDGSIVFWRWVHFGAIRVSQMKIWMFTFVLKVYLNLSSIVFCKRVYFYVFKVSKKYQEMQHNGGGDDLEGTKSMAIFCL
jgi:hypothetical protein